MVIAGTDGKTSVDLYPPLLYAMLAGDDGIPLDSLIMPRLVSKKDKMKDVIEGIKSKFGKEKVECRVWYRYMVNSVWKLLANIEQTVEELGLTFGDKIIIETKTAGMAKQHNN